MVLNHNHLNHRNHSKLSSIIHAIFINKYIYQSLIWLLQRRRLTTATILLQWQSIVATSQKIVGIIWNLPLNEDFDFNFNFNSIFGFARIFSHYYNFETVITDLEIAIIDLLNWFCWLRFDCIHNWKMTKFKFYFITGNVGKIVEKLFILANLLYIIFRFVHIII